MGKQTPKLSGDQVFKSRASQLNASDAAFEALNGLGLALYVAELENYGYTVIPLRLAGCQDILDSILEMGARISKDRNDGVEADFATGSSHKDKAYPTGQQLFYLLGEDGLFQQAMMNPVVLGFVRYMLNEPIISSGSLSLKGPGVVALPLHKDQSIDPIPRSLVCNTTYLLSDYDRDNGALCFVPGSHKFMRPPEEHENFSYDGVSPAQASAQIMTAHVRGDPLNELAVIDSPGIEVVEAEKGSLVVWHGNTWHGAVPRTTPGLRANLIYYWCTAALLPQEPYRSRLSDDVVAANGDAFAKLIGRNIFNGWMAEGPEFMIPGQAFKRDRERQGDVANYTWPIQVR